MTDRNEKENIELTENGCAELFIDPDPFSVFLGIAGFIGSVASIAGYIEFRRQLKEQNNETRFKNVHEAKDLLMTLEVDTMQVETSLRKLEFILEQGTAEQRPLRLSGLRLEFGTAKPLFTLQGFNKYDEVLLEINRLVGKSFETTSKLLQRLYNLNIQFGNDTYEGLIAFTKDLLWRIRSKISDEL